MFAKFTVPTAVLNQFECNAEDLTVEVKHVKPNAGVVFIGLYDKAADFRADAKRVDGAGHRGLGRYGRGHVSGSGAGRYAVPYTRTKTATASSTRISRHANRGRYGFSNDARGSWGRHRSMPPQWISQLHRRSLSAFIEVFPTPD